MTILSKKRMKGGESDSDYDWIFYVLFFIIMYTLGLIAIYTTNSELIGFIILLASQILLAYTIIISFINKPDGFKEFEYDNSVPSANVTFSPMVESRIGPLKPLFNINVAIIFELVMVFVSILMILITYGNINALYSDFGITPVSVLSDIPNTKVQPLHIHEKDNFKAILITLTAIVVCLVGIKTFYTQITEFLNSGGTNLSSSTPIFNKLFFAFLCVYFIGSIIFLFFGFFPIEIINTNGQLLKQEQQLPITIVSALNMGILCIFGIVCYNYYKYKGSTSTIFATSVNYIYMLFIVAIYYLSCWQIYMSNNLMQYYKPSNLLDPHKRSYSDGNDARMKLGEIQGCDPSKPETCPKPGYLPFQWLY